MALVHTRCPIDGTDDADVEVYPASFQAEDLNPGAFSARRTPDRVHYRMVRNLRTGCLRADPVLDDASLRRLYADSAVDCRQTWESAARTYRRYLDRALPRLPDRRGLLEIGCGHGPFLRLARDLGFARVDGAEPSVQAVAALPSGLGARVHRGFFETGIYPENAFSLVCGFHVLDHLADPNRCLQAVREVLVQDGVVFMICHDIGAPAARLLGRRCPMIDIEHPVLYDRRTVTGLFEKNGFVVLDQFGVRNTYPLSYWLRLAPLPGTLKGAALALCTTSGLGRMPLTVNFGNMGVIARKR
jgi:SAM-dependent methyltransferase